MKTFVKFSSRTPLKLGVISGLMVVTSYIPWPPWATLIAWTPLMLALNQPHLTYKQAWWLGWTCQAIISFGGFYWIAFTVTEYGRLPWFMGVLALLLFSFFIHWHIPIATIANLFLKKRFNLAGIKSFMIFSCVYFLFEHFWPMIFPWHLGYGLLYGRLPVTQLAEWIGFKGLNALLWLFNGLIAYFWGQKSSGFKKVLQLSLVGLAWLSLNGLGYLVEWFRKNQTQILVIRPLIVQPNVGNHERYWHLFGHGFQKAALNELIELTQKALDESPRPDFILWPESAVPDFLNIPTLATSVTLRDQIQKWNIPLITGAFSREFDHTTIKDYNSVLLFPNPQNPSIFMEHRKFHLLAFGEYTPLSDWFPALAKLNPAGQGFSKGPGPQTFDFRSFRVGIQICYESLFENFNRNLAQKDADFIVNVTNDSWFGPWAEPWQHLYMTAARSIELRRPIIRVTNTGISAIIDSFGHIHWKTLINERVAKVVTARLPIIKSKTLFTHFPWITEIIVIVTLGVSLLLSLLKQNEEKK